MEGDAKPTTASDPGDSETDLRRVTCGLGFAALGFVTLLSLYLAAAPVFTNDFWFHLKMGEVYASEGLWPEVDPMLHTAHEHAPVQHEWLFGVAIYGIERVSGFAGIRVFHAVAVLAILAIAWSLARRTSGDPLVAAVVTTLFAVLSWTRLFQLRPDLVSIPATLAIIGWFALERRAPSRRTWLVFGCLILVWANLHSLFALAPMLLFAALLGVLGQTVWEWRLLDGAACEDALRRNRSVAVALVLAICLTICLSLINPRGVDQLLTFLSSSQHTAIWSVKDEWSHFDPFVASNNPGSVSPLLWGVMNGVMIAFALSTMIGTWALVRRHKGALDRFDPVLFGLGLASIVAILMSVRFLWMAIFPLLFVARAIGRAKLLRDNRGPISWVLALGGVVLAVQFYRVGGFATTALRLPETAVEYLATPYLSRKFHVEGVRFLRETSVEGRLFNDYGMGGFLGYWLSPGLRTFIDSRTEHYPPEVVREYTRIRQLKESGGIGTILDLLDRREVDFFFGTGMPRGLVDRSGGSTVGHLDYVPGWILVSRSLDHAIYLRDLPRNEDSLRKIARYYRAAGIPFDRKRGFDVATAIDADLDWAVAHDLLTPAQSERIAGRSSEDVTVRANALETLALVYTLGGSYRAMLTIEAELDRLRAPTAAALRRRVLAHIKLDQPARAIEAAAQLVKAEGRNARSLVFQQLATAFAEISRGTRGRLPKPARQIALARVAQRVPLLTPFEAGMLQRALPGEPRVDAPR